MIRVTIGVDPDVVKLAEMFVDDSIKTEGRKKRARARAIARLSEAIQAAIDDWFTYNP